MSEAGIEIDSAAAEAALAALASAAADLQPAHQTLGDQLLERAYPQTPRRRGALAASGRVVAGTNETEIVYDEIYAGPIHNGWPAHNITPQPWLLETIDESHQLAADTFHDHIAAAL